MKTEWPLPIGGATMPACSGCHVHAAPPRMGDNAISGSGFLPIITGHEREA